MSSRFVRHRKLRPYIEGTHFKVITDHYSLKWLQSIKDPVGRIARWAVRLQQYDFDVVHRKGKEHAVPDTLSRSVPMLDLMVTSDIGSVSKTKDSWYNRMVSDIAGKPEEYPLWRLENGDLFKRVFLPYPDLEEDSDGWLRVIPKEERRALISAHHDPPIFGHLGVQKTYARLASKFYWPKIKEDVARYIRNCDICLKTKPIQQAPAGLMLSHGPTATHPFEVVSIDLVGPLPRSTSGFQYIVTMVDVFSKFVLFFPLRSATSAKVAQIFEDQVILLFGAPCKVIMDNGSQFKGKPFQDLLKSYEIQLGYIANYHAQANPVERTHRVVKTILSAYVQGNHRSWEKYLQKVACAIRSARHETTQLDPNFIVFGRRLKFSGAETLPQDVPKQNLVQEMELVALC
nr:unnamed protein product [Callosobruchus analis]